MDRYSILRGVALETWKDAHPKTDLEEENEHGCPTGHTGTQGVAGITGLVCNIYGTTGVIGLNRTDLWNYGGVTGYVVVGYGYTGFQGAGITVFQGVAGITGMRALNIEDGINNLYVNLNNDAWSGTLSTVDGITWTAVVASAPECETDMNSDKDEIVFSIKDKEALRISPEGFFVENRKVIEDREIYDHFKSWLSEMRKGNIPQ